MIRRARLADARAMAELHLRAWRRDYADIVPAERLAALDVAERRARWEEWLGPGADAAREILVFDQPGAGVSGLAATGPMRGERVEPGHGELYALYVEPAAQNAGVGTALLAEATAALRAAGYPEATLWVFRDNERGRRFYERHGWAYEPGSEALAGADWAAPTVRYRRKLGEG